MSLLSHVPKQAPYRFKYELAWKSGKKNISPKTDIVQNLSNVSLPISKNVSRLEWHSRTFYITKSFAKSFNNWCLLNNVAFLSVSSPGKKKLCAGLKLCSWGHWLSARCPICFLLDTMKGVATVKWEREGERERDREGVGEWEWE